LAYLPVSLMRSKATGTEQMRNKAATTSAASRSSRSLGRASGAPLSDDDLGMLPLRHCGTQHEP
jgi:hypothetical protein